MKNRSLLLHRIAIAILLAALLFAAGAYRHEKKARIETEQLRIQEKGDFEYAQRLLLSHMNRMRWVNLELREKLGLPPNVAPEDELLWRYSGPLRAE